METDVYCGLLQKTISINVAGWAFVREFMVHLLTMLTNTAG